MSSKQDNIKAIYDAAEFHEYTKLPPSHIRVLKLQPSLDIDAPLRFSFWTVGLDGARGEYEAISYIWGNPRLCCSALREDPDGGNDTLVLITSNLSEALRRFRHRLDDRFLWADAVCINQKDPADKAHQIPIMDKIYRSARRVIAWLGDGADGEEDDMRVLSRLSQLPRGHAILDDATNMERSMFRFFELPWFRRLWVLQRQCSTPALNSSADLHGCQ